MGNFKNELRAWQQIPRKLINDNSLSDRARFVYCYMACKPDDWDFYMEPLAKDLGYSVDTLRKYITELINAGWLTKGEQDHVVVGEGKKQLFGAKKYTLHAEKVPRVSDTEKVRHGKSPTLYYRDDEHNRNDEDKEEKDKSFSKKDNSLPIAAEPQQEYGDKPKKKRNVTPKNDPLFEECWKAYNRKGNKAKSKSYWDKLTEEEQQTVMPHIKAYVETRERRYQSDFERYLRDKRFNDVVYNGNSILYDPEMYDDKQTYHPYVEYPYLWQREADGKYYFTGNIINLADGYTKDNRPNGAEVHQNGYTYTWNSETKEWERK